MAINQNIVTDEVRANGLGGVVIDRLQRSIDQIADTYEFENRPAVYDVFDSSFLPEPSERMVP